jgi:uncharacterized protein involved in exopolysaccharide biosynthesis
MTNLNTRFVQAKAKEEAIRDAFQQQRSASQTQNEAAVSYRLIQQEIDTNKRLLNGLLERLGKNEVSQANASNAARVAEYALVPDRSEPDGPWRLPYVAVAFLLAFGLSAVATTYGACCGCRHLALSNRRARRSGASCPRRFEAAPAARVPNSW